MTRWLPLSYWVPKGCFCDKTVTYIFQKIDKDNQEINVYWGSHIPTSYRAEKYSSKHNTKKGKAQRFEYTAKSSQQIFLKNSSCSSRSDQEQYVFRRNLHSRSLEESLEAYFAKRLLASLDIVCLWKKNQDARGDGAITLQVFFFSP